MRHAKGPILCAGLFAVAILLTSCAGEYTIYGSTGNANIKPGSLAVVCGLGDELNVTFANQVTQDLQTDSKFTVMPQKKITEKFNSYPTTVIDDPTKFSDDDRSKFAKIQRGLGVDYILVLWTYDSTSQTTSGIGALFGADLKFSVGGRLLSYPGGKEAGFTDFSYGMSQAGRSAEETTHQMIVNASKEFEKEFLDKTGMAKEN